MSANRHNRDRDQELTECRDCGATFDLAAQQYYDDRCPSCYAEATETWRTWPTCVACQARIDPDDAESVTARTLHGSERVTVCSEGCRAHVEHHPQAPYSPSLDKGENPYGERVPEFKQGDQR